ncbi:MAG: DUF3617 family protein [Proteobacteria bacterium]|nr:DUF3617 family protein [Pseudomonadota bacterium]
MKRIIIAVATALPVLAAQAAPPAAGTTKLAMDVELGLWEVTSAGGMSGASPIPASVMAQLPPDQLAKVQAAMAKQNQAQKYKQCMTPEKLNKGFVRREHGGDDSNCQMNVKTNTSTEFAATQVCTAQKDNMDYTANIHFNLSGRHTAHGTVDVTLKQADGRTTVIHRTIDAQWLGSDCGTITDIQAEK